MRFRPPALLLLPALASCGPADTDPGPGGVTVEEARQLDEAAAKLDKQMENPPLMPGEDDG